MVGPLKKTHTHTPFYGYRPFSDTSQMDIAISSTLALYCAYLHVYACMHVYMYMYEYVCMCMCMHMYMYT